MFKTNTYIARDEHVLHASGGRFYNLQRHQSKTTVFVRPTQRDFHFADDCSVHRLHVIATHSHENMSNARHTGCQQPACRSFVLLGDSRGTRAVRDRNIRLTTMVALYRAVALGVRAVLLLRDLDYPLRFHTATETVQSTMLA